MAQPTDAARTARPLRWLLRAYLGLTIAGVVAFLLTPVPHPWTPAVPDAGAVPAALRDPAGRTNWAAVQAGGRVRAIHWDYFRSHHPLFVIDAEPHPTGAEKWASLWGTRYPWLEVSWTGRRDIDEVIVRHAGSIESPAYTNERYVVRCYRGDELVAEEGVIDNRAPVASHALACPQVDRIRLDFDCTGRVDVARIYEVEAWGL